MRSDNLRPAPAWFTPDLVGRMLEQIDKPRVIDAAGVPVVRMAQPKPALRLVENETPPVEHARRAEEREAEDRPASPPRRTKRKWGLHSRADFQELAKVAFERGIALVDLAHAFDRSKVTISCSCQKLGLEFGKRAPLAEPLTIERLRALANPDMPLPELRRDRLRRQRLARRAEAERQRRAAARQASICDDAHRPDRQSGRRAASREPAPFPPPGAGSTRPDRRAIDRANKLRADACRRRVMSTAEAMVDAGRTAENTMNPGMKIAIRAVERQRAEEARLADPVERAKTIIRRAIPGPVFSMSVYGGDPNLFFVGNRSNVTKAELLELAERYAA